MLGIITSTMDFNGFECEQIKQKIRSAFDWHTFWIPYLIQNNWFYMRMNLEFQIDRLINFRLFWLQFWKLLLKLHGAKCFSQILAQKSNQILHGTNQIFSKPKNISQIINFGFPLGMHSHSRTRFSLFYEIIIRRIRLRLTLLKRLQD